MQDLPATLPVLDVIIMSSSPITLAQWSRRSRNGRPQAKEKRMDNTGSGSQHGDTAAYCIGAGLGLLSFALLLHPMSPEHFFELLLTDPLDTVRHEYGRAMGILFWISAALMIGGLAGYLHGGLRALSASAKSRHQKPCAATTADPG
jgi:hypothetical protein